MLIRILIIFASVFAAGIATAAANTYTETPKKEQYQYVRAGNSTGFSFFPFLGIERVVVASIPIIHPVSPVRLPEEKDVEVISFPFVF